MPPDISTTIGRFVPNNPKLAKVVLSVCKITYKARFLPPELIKTLVDRAFDLTRRDIEVDSQIFEDKLLEYAKLIKPRFQSKIAELQRGKKSW